MSNDESRTTVYGDCPGVTAVPSARKHAPGELRMPDLSDGVTEQWDDIRAGQRIAINDAGVQVTTLADAYCIIHPTPHARWGVYPPIGVTAVGRPTERLAEMRADEYRPGSEVYVEWLDPETGDLMATGDVDGEERTVNLSERRRDDE